MNHQTHQERLNLTVAVGLLLIVMALIGALVFVREADLRGHVVILIGTGIGVLGGVLKQTHPTDGQTGGVNTGPVDRMTVENLPPAPEIK